MLHSYDAILSHACIAVCSSVPLVVHALAFTCEESRIAALLASASWVPEVKSIGI